MTNKAVQHVLTTSPCPSEHFADRCRLVFCIGIYLQEMISPLSCEYKKPFYYGIKNGLNQNQSIFTYILN